MSKNLGDSATMDIWHAPDGPYFTDDIYDAVGNILTIADGNILGGAHTQSFSYEAMDRLTSASASGVDSGQGQYSEGYAYNAIGNPSLCSGQPDEQGRGELHLSCVGGRQCAATRRGQHQQRRH